jgi:hypothetical protein
MGLFGDHDHLELACSYERDRLIFLGTSLCDRRFYIPHSMYEINIDCAIPFEVPLWWKIAHASKVNTMINDINKLMRNNMTKKEYLMLYCPDNYGFDVENTDHIENSVIDYEGWIAIKESSFDITDSDHIISVKDTDVPLTIYSKIKTEAYYISHKFHEKNISSLIELGKECKVFPLATKLANMCAYNNMYRHLKIVNDKTLHLLDFKDPENKIMVLIKRSQKLPKDPFIGFEKRTFDIQCRLVINFKQLNFGSLLKPLYLEEFPEIDQNIPDLETTLCGLTMYFQPWTMGYEDRIKTLDPHNPIIRKLIKCLTGIKNT